MVLHRRRQDSSLPALSFIPSYCLQHLYCQITYELYRGFWSLLSWTFTSVSLKRDLNNTCVQLYCMQQGNHISCCGFLFRSTGGDETSLSNWQINPRGTSPRKALSCPPVYISCTAWYVQPDWNLITEPQSGESNWQNAFSTKPRQTFSLNSQPRIFFPLTPFTKRDGEKCHFYVLIHTLHNVFLSNRRSRPTVQESPITDSHSRTILCQ